MRLDKAWLKKWGPTIYDHVIRRGEISLLSPSGDALTINTASSYNCESSAYYCPTLRGQSSQRLPRFYLLDIDYLRAGSCLGLTFDQIAKELGKDEVWVASAFYGQVVLIEQLIHSPRLLLAGQIYAR